MRRWVILALFMGCAEPVVREEAPEAVLARLGTQRATLLSGQVHYLGFEVHEPSPAPGTSVRLTHYWYLERPLSEDYRVFVHVLADGARGLVPHGDHDPDLATSRWPVGKVVATRHLLELPPELPAEDLELRVGLYRDKRRMAVDAPFSDSDGRIRAGSIRVTGRPPALPTYVVRRAPLPPVLDGKDEDAAWRSADWTDAFVRPASADKARHEARAKLTYDETSLYLFMRAEDPDVFATLRGRDAPIYREEALEIFIDADGDQDDYVELQVGPNGTMFDARFFGGPRQNMATAWDADFEAVAHVDGTLDDPKDRDKEWTSEWRIALTSLAEAAPTPGTCWRMNLFHVGKERSRSGEPGPRDESAWSPTLMGDFHNLKRFGRLCFDAAP